jgi:hypothetical protein
MATITNTIPIDEWDRARQLYDLARQSERSGFGQVRLRSDGRTRRWYVTDSVRAACFEGGSDSDVYDVGVPPALLRFSLGESGQADELGFEIDPAKRAITLRGSSGAITVEDLAYSFPSIDSIRPDDLEVGGRAVIRARDLHNAVGSAWSSKVDDLEDDEEAIVIVAVDDGELTVRAVNRRACDAIVSLPCVTTGRADVELNAKYLASIIELFRAEDELVVELPHYSGERLVLRTEDRWAVLMPITPPSMKIRQFVEEIMQDELGPLAMRPDDDGDYPLVRRRTPVYARLLLDHDPAILQVFAVVINGIEGSPELLKELNDLNEHCTFARVFHVDDQVLVEVDLVAETLDPVELNNAVHQVWDVGQRIMPTLSAVFGGEVVPDPAQQRYALYRTSVVEAEVTPGVLTPLNGADGVADWSIPGVAYVLTGWNPQGVSFATDENERVNRQIAASILEAGGRFVHGHGRSPSGDHTEPSLIAWGLSREDALAIGRRASQDAVFEIEADVVRLVSCVGDDVEEWDRLS